MLKKAKDIYLRPVATLSILSLMICILLVFDIVVEPYSYGDTHLLLFLRILFLVATLLASQYTAAHFSALQEKLGNKKFGILSCIGSLYTSFAVGGSLLLEHSFVLSNILKVLILTVWAFPFAFCFISLFVYLFEKPVREHEITKKQSNMVFWVSFAGLVVAGAVYLLAYFPGIASVDTVVQFEQALGISPLTDWQAPFHTLLLRALLSVFNHPAFVVTAQILMAATIMAGGMRYLYYKGLSPALCIGSAAIFCAVPQNMIHLVTIWKDIPYSLSLFWMCILFAKLIFPSEHYNKRYMNVFIYIELVVCLVFVALLRQNGLVPFVCGAVVIAVVMRTKKMVSASLIAGVLTITFLVIGKPFFGVLPVTPGGEYIGLGQDMIGVHVAGGTLSEDAQNTVDVLMGDDPEYNYHPSWAFYPHVPQPLTQGMPAFVLEYLDTFVNNPGIMTRTVLARNSLLWDVSYPVNAPLAHISPELTLNEEDSSAWLAMAPPRQDLPVVTQLITTYINMSKYAPFIWVFWRIGAYTLLMVFAVMMSIAYKNKRAIVVFVPVLGQMLSLILSTGWSSYHYALAIPTCVLFASLVLIQNTRLAKQK